MGYTPQPNLEIEADHHKYRCYFGLAANKPAAADVIVGSFYYETDTKLLKQEQSGSWVEVARGEAAIRLAQLSEKAHSSLTGVTASQHHTKYAPPSGLIAMWHGIIASIPSGWVICDGNNSTPNLLAKFIEGVATAATDPGATGGATSKTTSGHNHSPGAERSDYGAGYGVWDDVDSSTETDSISDIRPSYYDIAFIMKT